MHEGIAGRPFGVLGAASTPVRLAHDGIYQVVYFIGARLAPGPVGPLLGDLLIRMPSASGAGRHRRIPFEAENGRRVAGLNHFELLGHPAVYEQLRT
jgi:hypothetical protein